MTKLDAQVGKATSLRRAFDHAFSLPRALPAEEGEELLRIAVAGDSYAIRLREISGVVASPTIVALPAATPDLVGVAGIRGDIVPVFGLAALLGRGPSLDPPNWTVLCGKEDPVGLGFSEFEGYFKAPRSSFHADEARGTHGYVREVVRTDAGVLPVIEIPIVIANLNSRASHSRPAEEK